MGQAYYRTMKPSEYIEKAKRTEVKKFKFKAMGEITPRIEHGIFGIAAESGEIMETLKKAKFYGQPLDKTSLIGNIGDLMWFLAILCDELKVSFEEVWEKNIRKLKARYPEKYTDENALKRNIERERKELEK